jgi:predicted RNase H-like HicB family nuclease
MIDYHINLSFSSEDGGYVAEIPHLPGCSAFGHTPQEAIAEVLDAVHALVEAAAEQGLAFPQPGSPPAHAEGQE